MWAKYEGKKAKVIKRLATDCVQHSPGARIGQVFTQNTPFIERRICFPGKVDGAFATTRQAGKPLIRTRKVCETQNTTRNVWDGSKWVPENVWLETHPSIGKEAKPHVLRAQGDNTPKCAPGTSRQIRNANPWGKVK